MLFQKFEIAHKIEVLRAHFKLGKPDHFRQVPFAIAPVEC
jgi:hypothetical protein